MIGTAPGMMPMPELLKAMLLSRSAPPFTLMRSALSYHNPCQIDLDKT